jgi:NADH:ubiquinone oxidoreductase subunit F (NADH-binding)
MTALAAPPRPASINDVVWAIGAPRLLAGLDTNERLDAAAHLRTHGPLPGSDLDRLLALLDAAGVAGRGGAGFPLAAKIRALPRGRADTVVVNGSESEPGSRKDRTLLRRTPHLVLDGALALAAALGAGRVVVAAHDPAAVDAVRAAAGQRPDARSVRVHPTAAGFVAGEARALVRAIAGGPARPPGRRDRHATDAGVLLANAETLAQLAVLLRLGPRRFAETGTRAEPGTTLVTVGGAVARPGVVELPLGTPLGIALTAAGAVDARYVVTGGYHGSWLTDWADVPLSRAGLASMGGSFGAGVVLVLDGATCPLGELARVADWLARESAGQCGPCRFGLPALAADVAALAAGQAVTGRALAHAAVVAGRGACGHPDGAVRFITSGLAALRAELTQHVEHGGCGRPVLGRLPIGPNAVRAGR